MWPELFGRGYEMGLFVAGSILAGFAAFVWFAMRTARPLGPDPAADLWRRYEQGDLTSWESARLFRILAHQRAAAEQSAVHIPRGGRFWGTFVRAFSRATAWARQ